MRSSVVLLALVLAAAALSTAGCDEETLGPQTRGAIEGVVQDAETNDPIAQANVTTSPPTQSVLTGADGSFTLPEIPTGNYSIEASKSGYDPRTVQVRVQENQTTGATLLLERGEEFGPSPDSMSAQVTNWFTDAVNRDSSGADSLYADVEYSARNVGEVRIQGYELYFEIQTESGTFSREVSGDSLQVGQRDLGGFRKYITSEADSVQIVDIFWEAE